MLIRQLEDSTQEALFHSQNHNFSNQIQDEDDEILDDYAVSGMKSPIASRNKPLQKSSSSSKDNSFFDKSSNIREAWSIAEYDVDNKTSKRDKGESLSAIQKRILSQNTVHSPKDNAKIRENSYFTRARPSQNNNARNPQSHLESNEINASRGINLSVNINELEDDDYL